MKDHRGARDTDSFIFHNENVDKRKDKSQQFHPHYARQTERKKRKL